MIHIIEQTLIKLKESAPETKPIVDQLIRLVQPLEQQYVDQLEKQMGLVNKHYKESVELSGEKGVMVLNMKGLVAMGYGCPSCLKGNDRKTLDDAKNVLVIMTNPELRKTLGKVTGI